MSYNANLIGKQYQTDFNVGASFSFRGTGTEEAVAFDNRRYNASANFFHLRGGIEHTQKLAWDFQLVGGLQGQATANPLVDTEQFSLGGYSTVRGYLESSVVGDNAVCGTLELRSPSLVGWLPEGNEWRFLHSLMPATRCSTTLFPSKRISFHYGAWDWEHRSA